MYENTKMSLSNNDLKHAAKRTLKWLWYKSLTFSGSAKFQT